MRRPRPALFAACLVLLPGALLAQSGAGRPDPITGAWSGSIGQNPEDRHALAMELRYDGATITGTVTSPSAGDERGTFHLSKMSAQQAHAGASHPELREAFGEVSDWVSRAAALVPADRYGYRPVETVRTFGQLIGHLVDSYAYYCARARGNDLQWSDAVEKEVTDKAALIARLEQATTACRAAYDGQGAVGPLLGNIGHTSLHYGNMVTYLRMMGLVPPSS